MKGVISGITIAVALVAACGPSAKEVKQARQATYSCSEQQVFQAMVGAMKDRHLPIASMNPEAGLVVSDYRWHTKDGVPKKKGAVSVEPGDVELAIVAAMKGGSGALEVVAKPSVLSQVVGSPRGNELHPKDADWPEWADSKVDVYIVDVYQRLKSCANVEPSK